MGAHQHAQPLTGAGEIGATIELTSDEHPVEALFGEAPTRIVVSVDPRSSADLEARSAAAGAAEAGMGRLPSGLGWTMVMAGGVDMGKLRTRTVP